MKSDCTKTCFAMILTAALTACASTATTGTEFDASAAETLTVGVSSKSDVLSALGKPFQQTANIDGSEAWIYEFTSVENRPTRAAMFGGYAMLAGADTVKSKFSSEKLFIEIQDGMLSHCVLSLVEGDERGSVFGEGSIESAASGKRMNSVCAGGDPDQIPEWMKTRAGL